MNDEARGQQHTQETAASPCASSEVRGSPRALFVYGTLHPDRAPAEIREAVAQLRNIGTGTVTGERLDLGEYPGVILNGALNNIPGTLFALPSDPAVLQALDTYEGFNPADRDNSLFIREQILVTLANGEQANHWIYLYNQRP